MPFLGSASGYLIAMCSPGRGNLVAFDWNDLPVGREFDDKFWENVTSPPHSLPPPPPGLALIGALFKRSMLPCFGSTNHKGEITSLQGLQEYGKSWKESFTRENSFANEMYRTFKLTFVPVNGAWFSLKWRAQESKKRETLKMVGVFY